MKKKDPIAFNPFYVEDGIFDIEKKESIKTLILTLWKRDDEPPTRAEEVALSNAVNLFLEKIRRDSSIKPSFDTFYEFIRDEYQDILKKRSEPVRRILTYGDSSMCWSLTTKVASMTSC